MPYPLSSEAEAKIASGRMISAYLLDLYCLDSAGAAMTLRCWDWPGTLSYRADDVAADAGRSAPPALADMVTYASMARRLTVERAVRFSTSLTAEPIRILVDGSRAGDDQDFVGQFMDAKWHQRAVRCRQVLLDQENWTTPTTPVWTWRGRLDFRQLSRAAGREMPLTITCEGGGFRVRGRRMHTRTDADQRRRSASDAFFAAVPAMVSLPILFGKEASVVSSGGGSSGTPEPGSLEYRRYLMNRTKR